MSIIKELEELVGAKVITNDTAEQIRRYYEKRNQGPNNRLFVVFGILGAILSGLGIILIIAHNWDDLSRGMKTFFALLPLLVGQAICGFSLWRKPDNTGWRESSATFLFFALGACISLISQIYHIPGDISSFLLTWLLLGLPVVYVMNSSMASLLYITGATYFAGETGYWSVSDWDVYLYWVLLPAVLPHYFRLYRERPGSNFLRFHNWVLPLSLVASLGTLSHEYEQLMFIAYMSLFAVFYLLGEWRFFSGSPLRDSGFTSLGSVGTLVLLLILSFDFFWTGLRKQEFSGLLNAPDFYAALILTLLGCGLLFLQWRQNGRDAIKPFSVTFLLFLITFFIGLFSGIAIVLINLIILGIGVLTIRSGAKTKHLGVLNLGLITISALIMCRFFDTELSFVLRGIIFILVGIGFFTANYLMIKKRNRDAQ